MTIRAGILQTYQAYQASEEDLSIEISNKAEKLKTFGVIDADSYTSFITDLGVLLRGNLSKIAEIITLITEASSTEELKNGIEGKAYTPTSLDSLDTMLNRYKTQA